jgi:hypothetical protein
MTTNPYVARIAQAAGITQAQANQALIAVFQGLIDALFQGSLNTISITPTPSSGAQVFITVNNPPHPGGGGGGAARTPSNLVAYIAGVAGIAPDKAAIALTVALAEIAAVGQAAHG